jgi:ADP-ribose pyrophosphatase
VKGSSSALPRVAVGAVVLRGGDVLLVRRGRPPAQGLWAVPGGSVLLGEPLLSAAEREVREETGVEIRATSVVHVFDVIDRDSSGRLLHHYVVVDVLGLWLSGEPRAADDAADARWHAVDDLDALDISAETLRLVRRLSTAAP